MLLCFEPFVTTW